MTTKINKARLIQDYQFFSRQPQIEARQYLFDRLVDSLSKVEREVFEELKLYSKPVSLYDLSKRLDYRPNTLSVIVHKLRKYGIVGKTMEHYFYHYFVIYPEDIEKRGKK